MSPRDGHPDRLARHVLREFRRPRGETPRTVLVGARAQTIPPGIYSPRRRAGGVLPAATVRMSLSISPVSGDVRPEHAQGTWKCATDSCRIGWWCRGAGPNDGHRSSFLRHAHLDRAERRTCRSGVSPVMSTRGCLEHDDSPPRESYDSARLRSREGHRTEWCRQPAESIASTGSPVARRMGAACIYWRDGRGHQSFGAGFAPFSLPSEPWQPH